MPSNTAFLLIRLLRIILYSYISKSLLHVIQFNVKNQKKSLLIYNAVAEIVNELVNRPNDYQFTSNHLVARL